MEMVAIVCVCTRFLKYVEKNDQKGKKSMIDVCEKKLQAETNLKLKPSIGQKGKRQPLTLAKSTQTMFGIPYANLDLALLPQYQSEVPVGLQIIKQYLVHNDGFKTKGIFRQASQQNTYRDAMEALDMGEHINEINGMNVHVASQLLKAWFREYPVRTPGFLPVKLLEARVSDEIIKEFNNIKEPLRTIVLWLIDVAVETAEQEEHTSMTLESLSICLSPNLIRHEDDSTFLQYQRSAQTVFHSLCNLRKKGKLVIYATNINSNDDMSQSDGTTNKRGNAPAMVDMNDENASNKIMEEDNDEVKTSNLTSIDEEKGDKPDGVDISQSSMGYESELRHKRKRRRSSIVYASSVHELYKPSLSTGVFGAVYYPKRDVYTTIRRESTLHTKEVVYQALDVQRNPAFRLTYMADEVDAKLDLTSDEIVTVTEFGSILKERYNYENVLKSELIRYVIGSKGRIAQAERRFLNMKKLEREYNLNDIQLHQVRNELKSPRYVVCGKDVEGRSVLGINISHFDVKNMNLSLIIKAAMIYCDALTSDLDVCRNGIVLLFDMKGFKIEHLNSGLEKVFFSAFNDTYPLRIKRFIVVNAPMYIRGLIHIAKVLLSKKLGNRIVSCKSENGDKKASLWKEIDIQEAPSCVDGKFDNNGDGSYPTNAWSFVCSKVSGDLPPMTTENLTQAASPPDMSRSPSNGKTKGHDREISLSDHKWLKVKDGNENDTTNNGSNDNENGNEDSTSGKGGLFSGMFGKARDKMTQAKNKAVQMREARDKAKGKDEMKTIVTSLDIAQDDDDDDADNNNNENDNNNTNNTENEQKENKGQRKGQDKNRLGLGNLNTNANDPSVRSDAVVIQHKYKSRNENLSGNLSPQSNSMVSKSLPMPSETETEDRDVETLPAISSYDLATVANYGNDQNSNKIASSMDDVDLNASDNENDNDDDKKNENENEKENTPIADMQTSALGGSASSNSVSAPPNDDITATTGASASDEKNEDHENDGNGGNDDDGSGAAEAEAEAGDKQGGLTIGTQGSQGNERENSNVNLSVNESVEIVDSVDKSKSEDYVNIENENDKSSGNDQNEKNVATVTESPSGDKSKSEDFVNVESVKKDNSNDNENDNGNGNDKDDAKNDDDTTRDAQDAADGQNDNDQNDA